MKINDIVVKPHLTEKVLSQVKRGVYAFEVNSDASKNQIQETIEKLFSVTITSVKTITRKGKTRRVGKKMKTKQLSNRKIAYITVSKGKIDLFPQE